VISILSLISEDGMIIEIGEQARLFGGVEVISQYSISVNRPLESLNLHQCTNKTYLCWSSKNASPQEGTIWFK